MTAENFTVITPHCCSDCPFLRQPDEYGSPECVVAQKELPYSRRAHPPAPEWCPLRTSSYSIILHPDADPPEKPRRKRGKAKSWPPVNE